MSVQAKERERERKKEVTHSFTLIKCTAIQHTSQNKPQCQKTKLINSQLSRTLFRTLRTFFFPRFHTSTFFLGRFFFSAFVADMHWPDPIYGCKTFRFFFFRLVDVYVCVCLYASLLRHILVFFFCSLLGEFVSMCNVLRSSSKFLLCFNKISI